jgi:hypothetical protein
MSTGLTRQLASYGDVFAAEVDALARETIMTTDEAVIPIDRNEHDQKKNPWIRVGAFVGAAAIVIAAVAAISVLRTDGDTVAAPPYANAEEAVGATAQAIRLGDWDAYRAVFADDAIDTFYSPGREIGENEQHAEALFALTVASGTEVRLESCEASLGQNVTCVIATSDFYTEALGIEAVSEERNFSFEDGLLTYAGPPTRGFTVYEPVVLAFQEWSFEPVLHPWVMAERDYRENPIGKDPSVVVAVRLEAFDEFLAQYEG